jgi:uncharacterized protein
MKENMTALILGVLFSIGLGLSGMMDPTKVQGFLDAFGRWDPSLALVMGGALLVSFVTYPWIVKRKGPIFTEKFGLPTKHDIDKPLIIGAVLFGVGWAISGLCPGPALANAFSFNTGVLAYIATMFIGFWLHKRLTT